MFRTQRTDLGWYHRPIFYWVCMYSGENVKWDCGWHLKKQNKIFHCDPKYSLFYYVRPYLWFPNRTPCFKIGLKFGVKIIFLIFCFLDRENFLMIFDVRWRYPGIIFETFMKVLQLSWLTLKFNQSKNTTRIKIMMIFMRKSLILTNNSEKFSPSGGPPSGRLLKRRAVSDGPLRGG